MQQRQQQAASDNSKAWCNWVDDRIKAHHEQRVAQLEAQIFEGPDGKTPALLAAIGEVISDERETWRREVEAAIAE